MGVGIVRLAATTTGPPPTNRGATFRCPPLDPTLNFLQASAFHSAYTHTLLWLIPAHKEFTVGHIGT